MTFNLRREMTDDLQRRFNPAAVILHGSRAIGYERTHSDWDIVLLFKEKPTMDAHREIIQAQDIEIRPIQIPEDDQRIIPVFATTLQNAVVLWEANNEGTALLARAQALYDKGPMRSLKERQETIHFLNHKLQGMVDDTEVTYLFSKHLQVFLNRAVSAWFEDLHNEYSKPFYIAFPEIQKRDSAYYHSLLKLCSNDASSEKILAANDIISRLQFAAVSA